jgi:hypothetical protein
MRWPDVVRARTRRSAFALRTLLAQTVTDWLHLAGSGSLVKQNFLREAVGEPPRDRSRRRDSGKNDHQRRAVQGTDPQ